LQLHVVILAAGKGTRMKSARAKVLHEVAGQSLIEHVLAAATALKPATVTVIIGHQGETIREALRAHSHVAFVVQEPQLGTAHALLTTETRLGEKSGTLVLLSGDVPLLRVSTLEKLVETHRAAQAAATVLTTNLADPKGYGRIVRASDGRIARIVEDRDASVEEQAIHEINGGIYAFDLDGLFAAVRSIGANNAQREYYLPDLVSVFRKAGRPVETVVTDMPEEILGVNSRQELAIMNRIARDAVNKALMASGVTLEDPATTYVHPDVRVGPDTVIHPNVSLERGTIVGSGCDIHSGARLVGAIVGDRAVVLNHCLITDSTIGSDTSVGPFAHIRNGATLAPHAKVGNFVELKKTALGPKSKAMHLAYLGDAVIGERVNIGAGTITCNYDGVHKHLTTIEDGAFIGSDTQLIAPVTVEKDAYVGTGTTVRHNVPAGSLAISAGKQRNVSGWVERRKKTLSTKSSE
jgi:bifunctional UDP-N-acetylglucosamine pyrophosphorylase/glucosamine-1-phosphate N-acetyltransferase